MVADFTLVFDNAMRYNDDESLIYKDAKTLERAARHWLLDVGSPGSGRTEAKVEQQVKEVYTFLRDFKDNEGRPLTFPFMRLPPKSEYPDYYQVIREPMDLQMIFRNRRRYESLEEALVHFKLVFNNAMQYNREDSQIYRDAQTLEVAICNWQPKGANHGKLPRISS